MCNVTHIYIPVLFGHLRYLPVMGLLNYYYIFYSFVFISGESPMIPEKHSAEVISHICMVHSSVGDYSRLFLQKLRRCNFVTPKNYLDFINTYSKLLDEKGQYILGEKMDHFYKFRTSVGRVSLVSCGDCALICL